MRLKDFQIIANYLNEINRNIFTEKEVKENAKDYFEEWKFSKEENEISTTIYALLEELQYNDDFWDYYESATQIHLLKDAERILKDFILFIND